MISKLFTAPFHAVVAIAEKIKEEVDKELYDISHIQQQLVLLYTQNELGEMEETLFLKTESELLHRLEVAQELEWDLFLSEDEAMHDQDNE